MAARQPQEESLKQVADQSANSLNSYQAKTGARGGQGDSATESGVDTANVKNFEGVDVQYGQEATGRRVQGVKDIDAQRAPIDKSVEDEPAISPKTK